MRRVQVVLHLIPLVAALAVVELRFSKLLQLRATARSEEQYAGNPIPVLQARVRRGQLLSQIIVNAETRLRCFQERLSFLPRVVTYFIFGHLQRSP